MPTSLQLLVRSRSIGRQEENLEKGRVWVYTPGTFYTPLHNGFCWLAPGTGTAVIEMWGAGGSGGRMCCCGGGIGGNAGAYTKRTIQVCAGKYVCGGIGLSCGNADAICFRGCSDPSGLCWQGAASANGCMCAQGGAGGRSFCTTGASMYCCFAANGFCARGPYNENCGLICNYFSGIWIACGYGGDVNCCGQFSCTSFNGCQATCTCCFAYHIATPANFYSCCGGTASYQTEDDNRHSNGMNGQGKMQSINAVASLSRSPTTGVPHSYCWRSDRACGCYEMQGCTPYIPPGVGGWAPRPCPDHRDHAGRGGHGAVRIRFF